MFLHASSRIPVLGPSEGMRKTSAARCLTFPRHLHGNSERTKFGGWQSCRRLSYTSVCNLGCANKGPNSHINIRILHSCSKAQDKRIPETRGCRILIIFKLQYGPDWNHCYGIHVGSSCFYVASSEASRIVTHGHSRASSQAASSSLRTCQTWHI